MTASQAFAQVLREKRKELGLKQTDFEGNAQIDASFISKLELSKRQVCLENLFVIAEKLRMKPEDLITEVRIRVEKSRKKRLP